MINACSWFVDEFGACDVTNVEAVKAFQDHCLKYLQPALFKHHPHLIGQETDRSDVEDDEPASKKKKKKKCTRNTNEEAPGPVWNNVNNFGSDQASIDRFGMLQHVVLEEDHGDYLHLFEVDQYYNGEFFSRLIKCRV